MAQVFIGIGSNIDPEKNLKKGARLLRKQWSDTRFSSVYRTAPLDIEDQPPFLNAVCTFETDLTPTNLKQALQKIEAALGKNLPFPKGPRTIDLDLLLYGDTIISNRTLTIPHPRMHLRRFVLEPLCELIDISHTHPVLGETWAELLTASKKQQCDALTMAL